MNEKDVVLNVKVQSLCLQDLTVVQKKLTKKFGQREMQKSTLTRVGHRNETPTKSRFGFPKG